MTIRIKIEGFSKLNRELNQVTNYITNLDKDITTRVSNTNKEFMNRVLKGARMRAPRDTGALKKSIRLEPVRQGKDVKIWKLVAGNNSGAEHAIFQEEGFAPHMAPIMNSSKLVPGSYMVRKNTPFIKPAVEAQMGTYSQNLNKSVTSSVTKGLK